MSAEFITTALDDKANPETGLRDFNAARRIMEDAGRVARACAEQMVRARARGDIAGDDAWRIALEYANATATAVYQAIESQDWTRTKETP